MWKWYNKIITISSCFKNLSVIITHYYKDHFGDLEVIQYASYVYHNLGVINDKIKIHLPKNDFLSNKESIIFNNESYADYYNITDDFSFSLNDLKIINHILLTFI